MFLKSVLNKVFIVALSLNALSCAQVKKNMDEENEEVLQIKGYKGFEGTVFAALHADFEPSGIAKDKKTGNIFVVSDHGEVALLSPTGTLINTWKIGGDLEGVTTVDGIDGTAFILDEKKDKLLQFSVSRGRVVNKFELEDPSDPTILGAESLTYIKNEKATSGGYFVVGSQESGEVLLFDIPVSQGGSDIEATFVSRHKISNDYEDLAGLYHDEGKGKIYAVFDNEDVMVVLNSTDFSVSETHKLPGDHQEGILVDGCNVYLAEDKHAKVIVFPIKTLGFEFTNDCQ